MINLDIDIKNMPVGDIYLNFVIGYIILGNYYIHTLIFLGQNLCGLNSILDFKNK